MQKLNKEEAKEALAQLYPFTYDHELIRAANTMEKGEALLFEPYEWPFSISTLSAFPLNNGFRKRGSEKRFKLKGIIPRKKYILTRVQ